MKYRFFFICLAICFFPSRSLACLLCAVLQIVNVTTTVNLDKRELNNIHITWRFDRDFINLELMSYDSNKNGKFDENEWASYTKAFIDKAETVNYCMHLELGGEVIPADLVVTGQSFYVKDNRLHFSFIIDVQRRIFRKLDLLLKFEDRSGLFTFVYNRKGVQVNGPDKWLINDHTDDIVGPVKLYIQE